MAKSEYHVQRMRRLENVSKSAHAWLQMGRGELTV
jgi:hypothetical protein